MATLDMKCVARCLYYLYYENIIIALASILLKVSVVLCAWLLYSNTVNAKVITLKYVISHDGVLERTDICNIK